MKLAHSVGTEKIATFSFSYLRRCEGEKEMSKLLFFENLEWTAGNVQAF
jgi:hypothetical protein